MPTTIELDQTNPAITRIIFTSENGVQILAKSVLRQLREIIKALHDDPSVRIVVFEARGRTFTAGADLNELRRLNPDSAYKFSRFGQKIFQRISDLPAITISAIHATCAGGGLELSLACDFRLAASSATIGFPEVKIGIVPGWGGTVRSCLLLGTAVARRIILTGELLSAAEAQRLGLVDAVYPDADFRAGVDERIAQLLRSAPVAAARVKILICLQEQEIATLMFEGESCEFSDCYTGDEPAEGIAAFLEKRPAKWAIPLDRARRPPNTNSNN